MPTVRPGPAGYTEWRPRPTLSRYLSCTWTSGVGAPHPGSAEPVLPDGCMDIIWDGGSVFVTGPDTFPKAPKARTRAKDFAVGARFRPGAGPLCLGVPASVLRDDHVALELFWAEADQIAEELDSASDLREAAGVLDQAAARRCAHLEAVDPVVEYATRLWARATPASPALVAEATGVSSRQLHRRFVASVGYGPKLMQRVLRFQAFLSLCGTRDAGLAELAVLSGYSDQAHLSREVRLLADRSPAELRAPRRVSETCKTATMLER